MNRCPVCADQSCRNRPGDDGMVIFECPRCGTFMLGGPAAARLPDEIARGAIDRSALSHHIRTLSRAEERPVRLDEAEITVLGGRLRAMTPRQQHDRLILCLGDNQATPGQFLQSRKKPLAAMVGCHVTAQGQSESELDWLVDQMKPLELFETQFSDRPSVVALRLTLRGWERYYELRARDEISGASGARLVDPSITAADDGVDTPGRPSG